MDHFDLNWKKEKIKFKFNLIRGNHHLIPWDTISNIIIHSPSLIKLGAPLLEGLENGLCNNRLSLFNGLLLLTILMPLRSDNKTLSAPMLT